MREGVACPRTLASDMTRAATPSSINISASDCAEGRSGRVVSRRHSVALMCRYSASRSPCLPAHRAGGKTHAMVHACAQERTTQRDLAYWLANLSPLSDDVQLTGRDARKRQDGRST